MINLAMTAVLIYKTEKPYSMTDVIAVLMCLVAGVLILIYATIKELTR